MSVFLIYFLKTVLSQFELTGSFFQILICVFVLVVMVLILNFSLNALVLRIFVVSDVSWSVAGLITDTDFMDFDVCLAIWCISCIFDLDVLEISTISCLLCWYRHAYWTLSCWLSCRWSVVFEVVFLLYICQVDLIKLLRFAMLFTLRYHRVGSNLTPNRFFEVYFREHCVELTIEIALTSLL